VTSGRELSKLTDFLEEVCDYSFPYLDLDQHTGIFPTVTNQLTKGEGEAIMFTTSYRGQTFETHTTALCPYPLLVYTGNCKKEHYSHFNTLPVASKRNQLGAHLLPAAYCCQQKSPGSVLALS